MAEPIPMTWRQLTSRLVLFVAVTAVLDVTMGETLAALVRRVRRGGAVGVVNSSIAAEAGAVILGSSRASHGYDDEALTELLGVRVRNAGLDGRGILYARGLLDLIIARHAPQLVVLDVTYFEGERANAQVLAPYYGRSQKLDAILIDGDWRERVKLVSHSFRMNSAVLPILGNLGASAPLWGFVPLHGQLDLSEPINVRLTVPPPPAYVEDNLADLVADVRRSGAEIVFVESPSWGSRLSANVRKMYARVAENGDVPFIHILTAETAGFDASLFHDRAHLNAKGAKVFTRLVAGRLLHVLREGWRKR